MGNSSKSLNANCTINSRLHQLFLTLAMCFKDFRGLCGDKKKKVSFQVPFARGSSNQIPKTAMYVIMVH